MNGKLINKSAINVNQSSNRAAAVSLGMASALIAYGFNGHISEFFSWGPQAISLIGIAFTQWLQDSPSGNGEFVKSAFQLEGDTNAEIARSVINRLFNSGAVPGVGASGPTPDLERFGASPRRGNEGLTADTLESIANDVGNYDNRRPNRAPGTWVSAPESIEPNSDQARKAAWYAYDVAKGNAIPPDKFAELSQSGDEDDNSYSTPVQGGGEWQN